MADITDFVDASISIQDASPAPDAFGVLAIVAHTPAFVGWRTFSLDPAGLAEAVTAGVTADSPMYAMLAAAARQNPRIGTAKAYARPAPHALVWQLAPTPQATGYKHKGSFSVDAATWFDFEYVELVGATATTITTGLKAAIDAHAQAVTTNNGAGTSMTATHTSSAKKVYFRNLSASIAITDTSTDTALATDLAAAVALDNEFFGLAVDSTLESALGAAATFAEANKKMLIALTADTGVTGNGTTDVASDIQATGANFTAVYWTGDPGSWPSVGLLARQLSRAPGSSTFALKNIVGEVLTVLTTTQIANLRSKNAFFQQLVKGTRLTYDGKAAGGRFLDITYGAEWLKAQIQALVLTVMANVEKVPYTNEGVALVEGQLRAALDLGVTNKFLDTGYVVTVPKVPSGVTSSDRANRLLPNVSWSARLAGAIHKVIISGTLSV